MKYVIRVCFRNIGFWKNFGANDQDALIQGMKKNGCHFDVHEENRIKSWLDFQNADDLYLRDFKLTHANTADLPNIIFCNTKKEEKHMKNFGIVLVQKSEIEGLTKSEVIDLFDMLTETEAFPIELDAKYQDCCAMGFITTKAAEQLNYDYEESGLHDFVALILDDVNKESENCEYQFRGINIWLGYNTGKEEN